MAKLMLAVFVVFLQILFCDYGCCGYEYDRECCDDNGIVALIIGCVVGGLIFLGLTVSCIVCLVCMSIKRQGNRGRVIAPLPQQQGNANVAFESTHTNWTTSSYLTQPQAVGYPMGYTQYARPIGSFPQPPAYEERVTPSTAPQEYPAAS